MNVSVRDIPGRLPILPGLKVPASLPEATRIEHEIAYRPNWYVASVMSVTRQCDYALEVAKALDPGSPLKL